MDANPAYREELETPPLATAFLCAHCGASVPEPGWGTRHRNHCPFCLYSLHVDVKPGDRASLCRGPMEPLSLWVRPDGELMLLHRCTRCGTIKTNRISGDDDEELLHRLAGYPLECILGSRPAERNAG